MTYYELLPYAFKKFSVLRTLRTGLPTVAYKAMGTALPASEKPALFTMNIMPPMMTLWYHLVRKNLGDRVDTVIFDCSGTLNAADFPGARVQKYVNLYAATKSDEFLYRIARHRKIGWICDDDIFLINPKCIDRIEEEFADPNTASLSFRSRDWWHFEINGVRYDPSGSYCLALNRTIYCDKEHLSLAPCGGNTRAISHIGKSLTRFDTFDRANEILLEKGYRCAIVPEKQRDDLITGFTGVSSAAMLLWHFRTPQQMLDYLREPEDRRWRGNTLFTVLSGLLAISAVQQMHETITGTPYRLRAMPTRDDLERLREEKELLLREGHSFTKTLEVAERLTKLV